MLTLIVGGSASGKSEMAEQFVMRLDGPRCYIATMKPWDAECVRRIQKHRDARAGRGFLTRECSIGLDSLELPAGCNALLEDLGNLLANERLEETPAKNRILFGIEKLTDHCQNLTVVGNEVFSGGENYDSDTLAYLRELAEIQCALADLADTVVEAVCGTANVLKGVF